MVLNDISVPGISLAEVRSRRVPVEWFEAVAVIQELCRVLLESGGNPAHASIAPQHVVIDAAGSVRVTSNTARGGEGVVRRVGELLQMSLADSAFPVPLRLVIMQSVATSPFYASLAELASALEYFERPDRTGLIRALYERAQTHRPISDAVDQPPPANEDAALPRTQQRRRVSTRTIGASVAAVAAIAIGLAVSQVSMRPQDSVPLVDQPKKNVSDALTAGTPSRKRSAESGGAAARVSPSALHAETDVVTPSDVAQKLSSTGAPTTIAATELLAMEPVALREATVANAPDTIYSASDYEVTPPVATYPRLPAGPPAGVRVEDRSIIELLVDQTGHVESVRLRGSPNDLGEALLVTLNLSAAKTWRFLPAVKDGRPVRYRTFVQVWPTTR